jgi:extracellular elastinolytic metalloproteinase
MSRFPRGSLATPSGNGLLRLASDCVPSDAAVPLPEPRSARPAQRIGHAVWIGSGPFRVLKFLLLAALLLGATQVCAGTSPPALGPDHRPQPLTAPRAGDPATIATDYLTQNLAQLGLGAADVGALTLQSRHRTAGLGTNLFYQQAVDGIPVFNAITSVHVKDDGAILAINNGAIEGLAGRLSATQPTLSAADAFGRALQALGRSPTPAASSVLSTLDTLRRGVAFRGTGVTKRPVPVRLSYVPRADGSVRLAWELYLMTRSDEVWYVHVDALDGAILEKHNLVTHLDRYRVYGFNSESPISTEVPVDRRHDLTAEFGDRVASPQGWHSGLTTSGNNVLAVEDRDNDDAGGYSPNGTGLPGNLVFDFAHSDLKTPCAQPGPLATIASDPVNLEPCDPYNALAPNSNLPAAIVNLFYWNNVIHDVMMYYGFTEGAGNFQATNFTAEGTWRDVDAVFAQAQDGSGTNNANFFTPPDDGVTPLLLPPAMQMYEWSPPAVVRVNLPTTFADFDDGDRVLSAATASFGARLKDLSEAQRTGDLALGNDNSTGDGTGTPNDGCEPLVGFPAGKIALLDRGLCEFGVKALNAQQAGAKGMVLANTLGREIGNPMGPGAVGNQVTIPSVMIGESNGTRLKTALNAGVVNLTLQVLPVPARDSDFDNGVIAHEYGHGISNRLIGGPTSIACLINAQLPDTNNPGALIPIGEQMGEGWSDLYAMILTAQPTDTANTPRGVGAYISFQNEHGPGIRRYPYSRNKAVNPLTYGNVPGEAVPHGVGTVWATMVWDMYWNLIDAHGFEPNLFNHGSGAGNVRALHYINNGLVITKCRPSFVDGRNAILLAEAADGDLGDSCAIWQAFARRGLGVGALNPTGGEDHRQAIEDFTLPAYCVPNNLAPEARDDAYAIRRNATLTVAAPGVLANDADPDGAPLTAKLIEAPRNAKRFTLRPDGSFDYEPKPGFTGSDSFGYVAQDGQVSSSRATVTIEVQRR